jgi:hypothetical protein
MRALRPLILVALILACASAARAQVWLDDGIYLCSYDWLLGSGHECGTRSGSYDYVFIGTVAASQSINRQDQQLRVAPDEVFLGRPPGQLLVQVPSAACLGWLPQVGDRWLFFLNVEKDHSIVLGYESPSGPADDESETIDTLRRLRDNPGMAILRGQVKRGDDLDSDDPGVPAAKVTAERSEDHGRYLATADAKGQYEFQLLPPGNFDLTVDPVGPFHPDPESISLKRGECWDVSLGHSPRGEIRGHVRHADGTPAADIAVTYWSERGASGTDTTDADGSYSLSSLKADRYVVAITLPGSAPPLVGDTSDAQGGLIFFPGASARSGARAIPVPDDQTRDGIDFTLPQP